MGSKVLICLEVPSIRHRHEMLVPGDLRVRELLPLLIRAVAELSAGAYVSSGHEFLCAKRQNLLLDEDATLESCGIGSGDHLLLL